VPIRLKFYLVIELVSLGDFATYSETLCFMLLFTKRCENHAYLVPNTVKLMPSTAEAAGRKGCVAPRVLV
jgi:hypothetical protein